MTEGMILLVYEKTPKHGENKNTHACEFSKLKFEKTQNSTFKTKHIFDIQNQNVRIL